MRCSEAAVAAPAIASVFGTAYFAAASGTGVAFLAFSKPERPKEFSVNPSDILRSEHRVIEQVLACLETMADECEQQGRADQAFSAADQASLLEAFERVETHDMGEGTHQRYFDLANELADRYGVAPVQAGGGSCCGHH